MKKIAGGIFFEKCIENDLWLEHCDLGALEICGYLNSISYGTLYQTVRQHFLFRFSF